MGGTDAGQDAAGVAPLCFTPGGVSASRPIGAACAFDGSPSLGIFVASGSRLYGIDGTGIAKTLHQFGAGWPFETSPSFTQVIESRGDYVAAAVGATRKGQNPTAAVIEVVLMTSNGNVLFHSVRTVSYKAFLHLRLVGNDRGIFALSTQTSDGDSLEIVGPHGEHYGPVSAALPVTDPDAAGRLCVLREQEHRWLDPCTGGIEPIRAELLSEYTGVGVAGSQVTWVEPSSPAAAAETADGVEKLPLPLVPKVALFSTHPSGWQLLSSEFSLWSYATANVATGAVNTLDITIPSDRHRFGSLAGIPGFDTSGNELGQTSDGSIVLGMRDASVGRLYTSTDGLTWNGLGFPVGKVWRLVAIERSGTFLIAGTPMGATTDDWAPAPSGIDRVDYQQMQLVRPVSAQGVVLAQATPGTGFTRSYSLSADGGCAGTLLDDELEITSILTLEKTVVTLPEFTPVYGAWTFAPGPNATLGMN